MNNLTQKIKKIIKASHSKEFKVFIKFAGKQLIAILLVAALLFSIGYATYKGILIERTVKMSHILYQQLSKKAQRIPSDAPNKLFAYQYLYESLRKNNVLLYNYINPFIRFAADTPCKDGVNLKEVVLYIIDRRGDFCPYVKLNPSLILYSYRYKNLAYHSRLIFMYEQSSSDTLDDFESLMSKTHGKLYGIEPYNLTDFIIIPNFYSKQEIKNEIDNFVKECATENK